MTVYPSPEAAARGDIPSRFVRVVGVVIRGDTALVAQLTNDRPPFEVETAYCHREGEGWTEGSSGNSTGGYLATGSGIGTVVSWTDEVPPGVVAARFECKGREQIVPVEKGCVLVAFDRLSEDDYPLDGPELVAWLRSDGTEDEVPRYEISEDFRARVRAMRARPSD